MVRWHYEKPERLNEFEALAVEQNVVDWVLQRAQVEDRADELRDADGAAGALNARCGRHASVSIDDRQDR